MISGILPIDKPQGWTSHDVVARVRRVTGQRQVGHAGTLDPLATGVLLLVLGTATRLSSYLMHSPKVYCADVVLGVTTATDDAEAPIMEKAERARLTSITHEDVERAVAGFVGDIAQIPPAYAAIKQGGKKLYILAREGALPEKTGPAPSPRQVAVHGIDIVSWSAPRLRLRVHCGPGTYIRSLARDLGAALGVGGYLHALRRVLSGRVGIDACHSPDRLEDVDAVMRYLLPPDWAVLDCPAVLLSPQEVRAACMGQSLPLEPQVVGSIRLYDAAGSLVALGLSEAGYVRPFRVFQRGS